jgi:hypothetical protein
MLNFSAFHHTRREGAGDRRVLPGAKRGDSGRTLPIVRRQLSAANCPPPIVRRHSSAVPRPPPPQDCDIQTVTGLHPSVKKPRSRRTAKGGANDAMRRLAAFRTEPRPPEEKRRPVEGECPCGGSDQDGGKTAGQFFLFLNGCKESAFGLVSAPGSAAHHSGPTAGQLHPAGSAVRLST